jgi:hypothetical protein
MTPLVLFTLASVNPSSWEIAGAVALWTAGLGLTTVPRGWPFAALSLVMIGGSAIAAWSRPGAAILVAGSCGFIWLFSELSRPLEHPRRGPYVAIAASVVVAVIGYFAGGRPSAEVGWPDSRPPGVSTLWLVIYDALQAPRVLIESTSLLGWVDTPSPPWITIAYLGALGFFFLSAIRGATASIALALNALAGSALLFVIAVYVLNNDVVLFNWQPRYFVPFLVGIPIAASLYSAAMWRETGTRRLSLVLAVGVATAEILSHYQNLLRYTNGLGIGIEVIAWKAPVWNPSILGVLEIVALNAAGMILVAAGLLMLTWPSPSRDLARAPE